MQALALDEVAQLGELGTHLRAGLDPLRLALDRDGRVALLDAQHAAAVGLDGCHTLHLESGQRVDMAFDHGEHLVDRDVASEFLRQRRDAGIGDAARHEGVEEAQVGVAVQGEAVQRHAARDPDADRGDLAVGAAVVGGDPGAAAALDPGGDDAELGAHVDQHALHAAHVGDDVDGIGQPHDRVADELSRPVPGDLAAAVDIDDRDAVGGPFPGLGALARGVDGRVFEQQHGVGRAAVGDGGVDLALPVPGRLVVDASGADHLQFTHGIYGTQLAPRPGQVPGDGCQGQLGVKPHRTVSAGPR